MRPIIIWCNRWGMYFIAVGEVWNKAVNELWRNNTNWETAGKGLDGP